MTLELESQGEVGAGVRVAAVVAAYRSVGITNVSGTLSGRYNQAMSEASIPTKHKVTMSGVVTTQGSVGKNLSATPSAPAISKRISSYILRHAKKVASADAHLSAWKVSARPAPGKGRATIAQKHGAIRDYLDAAVRDGKISAAALDGVHPLVGDSGKTAATIAQAVALGSARVSDDRLKKTLLSDMSCRGEECLKMLNGGYITVLRATDTHETSVLLELRDRLGVRKLDLEAAEAALRDAEAELSALLPEDPSQVDSLGADDPESWAGEMASRVQDAERQLRKAHADLASVAADIATVPGKLAPTDDMAARLNTWKLLGECLLPLLKGVNPDKTPADMTGAAHQKRAVAWWRAHRRYTGKPSRGLYAHWLVFHAGDELDGLPPGDTMGTYSTQQGDPPTTPSSPRGRISSLFSCNCPCFFYRQRRARQQADEREADQPLRLLGRAQGEQAVGAVLRLPRRRAQDGLLPRDHIPVIQ